MHVSHTQRAIRTLLPLLVASLTSSCLTMADPETVAHGQGFYVSGMGAYTTISDKDLDGSTVLVVPPANTEFVILPDNDAGTGAGVALGFRGKSDSIELNWTRTNHDATFAGASGDTFLDVYALDGRHFWRVKSALQPFMLLGVCVPHLTIEDGSGNGTQTDDGQLQGLGMHVGAGLSWYLGKHFSLDATALYRWAYFDEAWGAGFSRGIGDQLDASGVTGRVGLTLTF